MFLRQEHAQYYNCTMVLSNCVSELEAAFISPVNYAHFGEHKECTLVCRLRHYLFLQSNKIFYSLVNALDIIIIIFYSLVNA